MLQTKSMPKINLTQDNVTSYQAKHCEWRQSNLFQAGKQTNEYGCYVKHRTVRVPHFCLARLHQGSIDLNSKEDM